MKNTGNLKITAKSELEIVITREFNASPSLVFEAFTKPDLVKRWLTGPPGWVLEICEIDLKTGGKYRYVWQSENGTSMGMGGIYREVKSPERIVHTEKFDEAWYPGESVITTLLTENSGRTIVTSTMLYISTEARDAVIHSPMEKGLAPSYDRLDEILESAKAQEAVK
ncbi:hypothetical protein LEP1GSC058_1351 [Leptospira fainei serovar Hurstbridge str. BUT 6]|uniref:Activator of Hsp90 ATPase homologue 1/2-like C-terminal domain-containing protein n=1 Tax=Leptospira fainei serovar Hurstbridge str. BUT 6 TaxID=1193011 RepID=S3V4S4_9LEPT|nr:SRPBCC family protein [Leptospira fainei]EPG76438.1 hypothetical protein LEP1GSC058_1351 [Leptospira fainei serovar Hurstbridge str. BUT 6]